VEWDELGYTGYGGRGRIHRSQKPCENDLPEIPDIDLANSSLNFTIQSKSPNGPYVQGVRASITISLTRSLLCPMIPSFVIIKRGNGTSFTHDSESSSPFLAYHRHFSTEILYENLAFSSMDNEYTARALLHAWSRYHWHSNRYIACFLSRHAAFPPSSTAPDFVPSLITS
jgi:hypothetical protein